MYIYPGCVVDAGGIIYADMVCIYFVVFSFPADDSTTPSFNNLVIVYNVNISGLYGGVWHNWSGVYAGQLAIQHLYHWHCCFNGVRMGAVVCANQAL